MTERILTSEMMTIITLLGLPIIKHTTRKQTRPVHLNKALGIRGLFENDYQVIVHDESDGNDSTCVASPALLAEDDDDFDPCAY